MKVMDNNKESLTTSRSDDEYDEQLPPPSAVNVCCCCLELAWKRFLWTPYIWLDKEETCGDLLDECFGILLPYEEHKKDKICEVCITQLRSAMNFKRQVLTCQQLLLKNVKVSDLRNIPNLKFATSIPDVEVSDTEELCNAGDYDKELDYAAHYDYDDGCDNEVIEELDKDHSNNSVRTVELIKNRLQRTTIKKETLKKGKKKLSNNNKDELQNIPNLKCRSSIPDVVMSDTEELHNVDDYDNELDNYVYRDDDDELDSNVYQDDDDALDNDVYQDDDDALDIDVYYGDDELDNDVYYGDNEVLENDFHHDNEGSENYEFYEASDKGHNYNIDDSVEPVLKKKKSRRTTTTKELPKKKLTKLSNSNELEVQNAKVEIAASVPDEEICHYKKLHIIDKELDNYDELENDPLHYYDDSGGHEIDVSYKAHNNNIAVSVEPVLKKNKSRRATTAKEPPKRKFKKLPNNNEDDNLRTIVEEIKTTIEEPDDASEKKDVASEQLPEYDEQESTPRRVTKKTQNKAKKKSNLSPRRSRRVAKKNSHAPPAETITHKKTIQKSKKKTNKTGDEKTLRQLRFLKPRQNTCLLLAHSSMLPFKANLGWFFCFYCNKQMAQFEEVRRHTTRRHRGMSVEHIAARLYRPERVRVDVGGLACALCRAPQRHVPALADHLARRHAVSFNQHARTPADCVIPYDMSGGKQRCSVCGQEFLFFKSLSKHMNEHTTNYVCDVCGKCFLLPERLARHRHTHSTAAVECARCGKTARNQYALQTHMRSAHGDARYACTLCDVKFKTFKERLRHLEKYHGRKASDMKCEQCDKSFTVPSTLYAHVKRSHLHVVKPAKFGCDYCGVKFRDKTDLRRHIASHTGERRHACGVCGKRFARSTTLAQHAQLHGARRWQCGACGRRAAQRAGLVAHVRASHKHLRLQDCLQYNTLDE